MSVHGTLERVPAWIFEPPVPAGIQPSDVVWVLERIPQLLAALLLFHLLARGLVRLSSKTVSRPPRVDPLGTLVNRLPFAVPVFLAFTVGLLKREQGAEG
jgi:hypothetical protein